MLKENHIPPKENYDYHFVGKLNSLKRYDAIGWLLFLSVIFLGFSRNFDSDLMLVGYIIIPILIIIVLVKIKPDEELLLFTEDKIVHLRKKMVTEYDYADAIKNEFFHRSKFPNFVRLTFHRKRFDYVLDTKSNLDANQLLFIDLLLTKNEKMLVTERESIFDKYKYFKLRGEVKRVLMK